MCYTQAWPSVTPPERRLLRRLVGRYCYISHINRDETMMVRLVQIGDRVTGLVGTADVEGFVTPDGALSLRGFAPAAPLPHRAPRLRQAQVRRLQRVFLRRDGPDRVRVATCARHGVVQRHVAGLLRENVVRTRRVVHLSRAGRCHPDTSGLRRHGERYAFPISSSVCSSYPLNPKRRPTTSASREGRLSKVECTRRRTDGSMAAVS